MLDAPALKRVRVTANVGLSPTEVAKFKYRGIHVEYTEFQDANLLKRLQKEAADDLSHIVVLNEEDIQKVYAHQKHVKTLSVYTPNMQWLERLNAPHLVTLKLHGNGGTLPHHVLSTMKVPALQDLFICDMVINGHSNVLHAPRLETLRFRHC